MVARLRPGVTLGQARAEVHAFGLQLQKQYPQVNSGRNEIVVPINQTTIPPQLHRVFARAGALMMGIVGLVLLIACANVANLLLARAIQRQREIAVRLALGASRLRLIRQLLTESLVLALLAGALGILCAYWAKSALLSFLPLGLVRRFDFSLDGRVFLYTLGLAVIATVLVGLVPALQASRRDSLAALKDRSSAPTGNAHWYGLRGVLVMIQVVLSLIALVGGGLFIHSLRNAEQVNPGFAVKHDITMFIDPGSAHYAQPQSEALYRDLRQRLDEVPMIASASVSDAPPLGGSMGWTTFTDGVDRNDPRNGRLTPVIAVTPEYFSTRRMSVREGRDFNDADDAHGAMVAIVNSAAADTLWPGQDPIGKHLHFITTTWVVTVVGEVNTVKYATLGEPPQAIIYWPLQQHYSEAAFLFVRAKGDPRKIIPAVRSALHSLAPGVALLNVRTIEQTLDQSLTAARMGAELLGTFGLLALILAAVGTYGVMSYAVSQRTNEIGIRMALGAQPGNVLRLILSNGMAMVLGGVVVGLGLSVLLA